MSSPKAPADQASDKDRNVETSEDMLDGEPCANDLDPVDEAIIESFPASDPPGWTL